MTNRFDDWLLEDDLNEVLGGDTPPDLSASVLAAAGLRGREPAKTPARREAPPAAAGRPAYRATGRFRASRRGAPSRMALVATLAVVIAAAGSGALAWKLTADYWASEAQRLAQSPGPQDPGRADNPASVPAPLGVRVRNYDELSRLGADTTAIEFMPDAGYAIGPMGARVLKVFTIRGDFAEQFSRFTALESLRIENCAVSRDVMRAIGRLENLRSLVLRCNVSDGDLSELSGLQKLERLDLADNPGVTDRSMTSIAALNNLRALNLSGCGDFGRVEAGHALASLPRLRDLDLSATAAGRADFLKGLEGAANLRRLALNDAGADDSSMEVLASFDMPLETLEVGGNWEITAGGVAAVARLTTLRRLSLRGLAGVSAITMYALRPLVHLVELDLTNCQNIDAETLVELGRKDTLEILRLAGCDVTDEVVGALVELPLLELDLTFTRVTDAGIRHLAGVTTLRRLSLGSCAQLTGQALVYLSELPSLQSLDLEGSRFIPESAVVAFQRARPRASIVPPR